MKSYQSYTDSELARLLQQGERGAFDTLYERYWLTCLDMANQRLGDPEASKDVVQNVFLNLWQKREQARYAENIGGFLNVAVRNATLNYIDRLKTRSAFEEPFRAIKQLDRGEPVDAKLLEKDLLSLILAFAKTMPEKRREIFLLHIEQRLTTKEIAEKLGVEQKTVQNQLRTAILSLQDHLGPALMLAFLAAYCPQFN